MNARPFLVAIDGPAGAGKSTASRKVAQRLGFALVDTGAIYRAVALAASRQGIALTEDDRLTKLLATLQLEFRPGAGGSQAVLLSGEDISAAIRTPEISLGASAVSARAVVRDGLLELQRRLALGAPRGAVLEGRDIGTVVFPEADAKIYLTAAAEVRAGRRHAELTARGEPSTLEDVLRDQQKRDKDDMARPIAPLRPADDAVLLDSTGLSLDEVVDRIVTLVEGRMGGAGARS